MEWLIAELQKRSGLAATFTVSGNAERLQPSTELALFRIVQEALHNVEKHALATVVAVRLAFEDGHLRLIVSDNGQGFKQPPTASLFVANCKLGLVGMRERAELLGGTFELETGPGEGTRICVTIASPIRGETSITEWTFSDLHGSAVEADDRAGEHFGQQSSTSLSRGHAQLSTRQSSKME